MASEIVRRAIIAVIDKTPFQSTRASKLRLWGKQILDQSSQGDDKAVAFDMFSCGLVSYLKEEIAILGSKYKSTNIKKEHLWSSFYILRIKDTLPSLWRELTLKLDVIIDDPLLEQSIYQEVFEGLVQEYFSSHASVPSTAHVATEITDDELNVMRYVSGYVGRSLLQKYEKKSNPAYVACLSEMAVEGEGDDALSYTRKWFEKVDRGGLFPTNDKAFQLFVEIEKSVRTYLPQHITGSQSDKGSYKKNVHDKILQNEEVQFHWTVISQDIDDPNEAQHLLKDIIELWVTIRGFSMVGSWLETYKKTGHKNIQKAAGLRKSLNNII